MNRLASNSNNHSVHSNRVIGRFEFGLETGSRPHFSGFEFEFEVFRIRQSNPPLTGQRGPDDNRDTPVPNYSKSIRKKPPVEPVINCRFRVSRNRTSESLIPTKSGGASTS